MVTSRVEILEACLGRRAERRLLPMQPGDVPATFADVADLARDVGFAPRTPLLTVMHNVGKLFPRGDRAPAIVPVGVDGLRTRLSRNVPGWQQARTQRIASGFYTSQACEMTRGQQ